MAINIPIISEFDGKGVSKAIKQFKQLETTGEKAQFAIKKAAVPAAALFCPCSRRCRCPLLPLPPPLSSRLLSSPLSGRLVSLSLLLSLLL